MKSGTIIKKIVWTVIVIIVLVILGSITRAINYEITQEYAVVATDQVKDDASYTILRTQKYMTTAVFLIYVLIVLVGMFLIYKIWRPVVKHVHDSIIESERKQE